MKISKIEQGTFKLDGGATFGVVPKVIWRKLYPVDENNLCPFELRSLIVETDNKVVLIDTGMGNKMDKELLKYYYREGHHDVEKALHEIGYKSGDITDVIITHLHFDHVGGAVKKLENGVFVPTFKNATYHISKAQWEWAMNPNPRERASFMPENYMPLFEKGLINFIEEEGNFCQGIDLRIFNGHTAGLIVPEITYNNKKIVYTADLIPLASQLKASWVCGFDTRPLLSFDERTAFLKEAAANNYYLFFEHDVQVECCSVQDSSKGVVFKEAFKLNDIINS